MLLITSGAYIGSELASEFGMIPPSFLPVGNRRLYQHQVKLLRDGESCFLTVPFSFNIESYDLHSLNRLGVSLIRVPDNLKLGESIAYALNMIGNYDSHVRICHGDTLVLNPPNCDDFVSSAEVSDYYSWAEIKEFNKFENVILNDNINTHRLPVKILSGFFSFKNIPLLLKSIMEAGGDFLGGLNKYHEIRPLKSVFIKNWLDFGHINTFFRSKAQMTTQRHFNEMVITPRKVQKTSAQIDKIKGEIHWFQKLPSKLRCFIPHLLSWECENNISASYDTEYLYLSPLNDLFVFGKLPPFSWEQIFNCCDEFLNECAKYNQDNCSQGFVHDIFLEKTKNRLRNYCEFTNFDLVKNNILNGKELPSINEIAIESSLWISQTDKRDIAIIHGDFCFSNIFFDFKSQSIKVIDPRGIDSNGSPTLFGDVRYDFAKLAHSVIGLYDFILAKYYSVSKHENTFEFNLYSSDRIQKIQELFLNKFNYRIVGRKELFGMLIHLFLSMLPFHVDGSDKHLALLANALRIYSIAIDEG